MSTIDERRDRASAGVALRDGEEGWEDGFARPRVFLQPIAAPSVLGLFGFAGATLVVAANLAGWYGNSDTPMYLAPFAAFFGGLAQFMAGMWAYRARDAVATAMHGMWGAFWMAYGLLFLLVATGQLATGPTMNMALAFWFIALCAITISGTLGAVVERNVATTFVLGTLAAGSACAAIGLGWEGTAWQHAGGWLFVFAAGFAWYTATAMMLAAAAGRTVLPLFRASAAANIPGRSSTRAIELAWAEPGVKQGQ